MQVRSPEPIRKSLTQKSRELTRMTRHDTLTGLADRTLFMERATEALAQIGDPGDGFTVLLLDLDRFKEVNDSLGHAVGDALLQAVAERLLRLTDDADDVVRLGGDEFATVYKVEARQEDGAITLAASIISSLTGSFELDGRKLSIGTSVGIASAPKDGTDADTLIKNADCALYKAKSEGGNRYCLYDVSMKKTRGSAESLKTTCARL